MCMCVCIPCRDEEDEEGRVGGVVATTVQPTLHPGVLADRVLADRLVVTLVVRLADRVLVDRLWGR